MKESFATRVEVYSMSTLPNVMILIGSTKVNGQDVVLVKAVYFTLGKSQPMKKVSILLLYFSLIKDCDVHSFKHEKNHSSSTMKLLTNFFIR